MENSAPTPAQSAIWHIVWQVTAGHDLVANPALVARIRSRLLGAHRGPKRELLHYLLTPTEIHLLSRLPAGESPGELARAIGNIVARWVHQAQGVAGLVFAGPYRAYAIESDDAARGELRMLAWRPVSLRLARTPTHHATSSLRTTLGLRRIEGFDVRKPLCLFAGAIPDARVALRTLIARRPTAIETLQWEFTRGMVPVPIDAKGLIIENLVDAFERTGARALYVQPAFQNPTGAVLDRDRRGALLQAAADAGAFVIEDDFARWLGHGSQVPRPLIADDQDGRVIYVTSLTKVTAPSLRIGAVISRGAVTERIRALRMVDDMFVPRPAQEAALELVSSAGWDRHLRHLANALRQRSEALSAGLARHLPALPQVARPAGGMHRWVPLPPGFDDTEVAAAARRAGVIVTPGRAYYPAEPPGPHLRLTFAAASDVNSLDEGLRRLALALSDL